MEVSQSGSWSMLLDAQQSNSGEAEGSAEGSAKRVPLAPKRALHPLLLDWITQLYESLTRAGRYMYD